VRQVGLEPDWGLGLVLLDAILQSLAEYAAVRAAIVEEPLLAAQMDMLVGSPYLGAIRVTVDSVVNAAVGSTIKAVGQPIFDGATFDTCYAEIEASLASPDVMHIVLAPLLGYSSETEVVRLTPTLSIRPLNESELARAIDLGLVTSIFGPGRPIFDPPSHTIELSRPVPKTLGDLPIEPVDALQRFQLESDNVPAHVVSGLRLFKGGNLATSGRMDSSSFYFMRDGGSYRVDDRPLLRYQPGYHLSESEAEQFVAFYQACNSEPVAKSPGLAMALRRMSFHSERPRPDDQIVDLMIAAEALFLGGRDDPERGEQRYRLALRAAAYTPTNTWDRRQLFRLFRSAYDARSVVAHGGTVNKCRLPDGQDIALVDFVKVAAEQLRSALKRAIEDTATAAKPFAVDWEALLLARLD
jgi:hypothetical protein